jgi:hypothetical protein
MSRLSIAAPLVITMALVLAGCSGEPAATPDPTGASAPDDTATAAAPAPTEGDGDPAAASGECPTVPQEGYELMSNDAFSEEPASGAVWGDGSLISWTFADGAAHIVGVDMSYVNGAGDAIPTTGIFLDDMGGGQVGSSLLVFNSEADGRPGFMTLTETEGTDTETLGVYCVTFKVAP